MFSLRQALSSLFIGSPPELPEKSHLKKKAPFPQRRIFNISEIPKWMQLDPHIRRGYRTQLNSFKRCFWSLFYLHNETVNIWSHILPGISFLGILFAADYWIAQVGPQAKLSDLLAIQSYVAGSAGCLIFSATFHTTNAHSPGVAHAFLKLDYLGIVLNISTTCTSIAYFAMYGQPMFQSIYISFTVACAVTAFYLTLDTSMDGARAGTARATVFALLAASGLVPIIHNVYSGSICDVPLIPWDHLLVSCTAYTTGATFYLFRFPERIWPSRFDFFGASHQIYHVMAVVGIVSYFVGLRNVLVDIQMGSCMI